MYGFGPNGEKRVRVQREPVCPEPIPVMAIGVGLLVAILLAGIVFLLAWRLLTYLYDKREYVRYVNESKQANWSRVSTQII